MPTRESKWAERVVDAAAVPVAAVGVCDEAELVYACDEGTEEEEVDEGDERGGALGSRVPDEGVDAPEDGDYGDDEENENERGCYHVGF